jgi:nitrous oxide reductase accessory protein NosL
MVGHRLILIAALALPCPCSATAGSAGAKTPEVRAKIVYIDVKNAFFVIDKGVMDGAGADTAFTIVRENELEV